MSKFYNIVDIKTEYEKARKEKPKEDWKKIEKEFREMRSNDGLKLGMRIKLQHREHGLIAGKIQFLRNGVVEILTDDGTYCSVNKKYCIIL